MIDLGRREVMRLGGALGAAALLPGQALAAPARAGLDAADLAHVHPELRSAAAQMVRMTGAVPPLSDRALPTMRKGMTGFVRKPLADVPYRSLQVPGPPGAPPVTLYVINERAGTSRPAILHTHGGGFIVGTAAQDIRNLQDVAKALDCVIVTVDYRLAPETSYDGSIEDNYAGLRWLHRNAEAIGADRKRIAVMGESAGGGHAALLAIAARDRGEIPLVFQCLIYPMLDDRTGSSRPVPPHVGKLVWTADSNRYGWRSFLHQAPGTATVPARAVPARNRNLSGLPPAFIVVGSIDLFVEEDVTYAKRLIEAGVQTELLVVPGAFHGFDMFPNSIARQFNAARLNALRRAFGLKAV